jgi:hypothetical protein
MIYLVRDGKGSNDGPTYHVMTVESDNPQPREIATLGSVNWTFSLDTDHGLIALATDYTDNPEMLLVDIKSGAVTSATDIQGGDHSVTLGPGGVVAFCDSMGQFKVGTLENLAQSTTVERHHPAQGCPSSAWRDDSTLAFVAEVPLDDPEPHRPQALYLRSNDGTLTRIDLGDIHGGSTLTWSSDGGHVAFSSGFNEPASAAGRIISVEVAPGRISDIGSGDSPHFAPDDPDRLVALRDEGNNNRFLDVWQAGKVIASLETGDVGVAWCPDGNQIALVNSGALATWNWRTGERRVVVKAQVRDLQLLEQSVACF